MRPDGLPQHTRRAGGRVDRSWRPPASCQVWCQLLLSLLSARPERNAHMPVVVCTDLSWLQRCARSAHTLLAARFRLVATQLQGLDACHHSPRRLSRTKRGCCVLVQFPCAGKQQQQLIRRHPCSCQVHPRYSAGMLISSTVERLLTCYSGLVQRHRFVV